MRIALLTDGIYPFVVGGIQKHSLYLAKYFAKYKVRVELYYTCRSQERQEVSAAFTVEELNYINLHYIKFPKYFKFPGHYLYESYKYSEAIYKDLQFQPKVDFIYAQGFTSWKLLEQKNKHKLPKTATNLHGLNMYQYSGTIRAGVEASILRYVTNYLIKKSDYCISLGGKLTNILRKLRVNNSYIIEQPVAIEESWIVNSISISKDLKRFLFIGRYDKVKGLNLLNKAILELSYLNCEFHIVGPIPDNKKIDSVLVHYHGLIIDEQELKSILNSCDILVCPSFSEGMPTVVLEAMASGLAIIATDVGAVSKIVSEKNGWLIPPANIVALKQAIHEAIECSDDVLLEKKKASVNLVAKEFTWDNVIKKTIKRIRSIVNIQH